MKSLRILIADDDRDSAELLAVALRMWGHTVAVAYDGDEALARARSFAPEVMLLDLGMPAIDGLDVAERIAAGAYEPRPRLIAITAWGRAEDLARAEQVGFSSYLVKPIELPALKRILEQLPE